MQRAARSRSTPEGTSQRPRLRRSGCFIRTHHRPVLFHTVTADCLRNAPLSLRHASNRLTTRARWLTDFFERTDRGPSHETSRVRMVPDHVFNHLQIYDRRERWIVGCAELALKGVAVARISRPRRPAGIPDRILLLRLERIGDLLMILSAITAVRTRAPHAEIDLVVGSWNEPLARLIPDVTRIEVLDASWLAREHAGASKAELIRRAWGWRERRYDLAINFEPDIRSNLLLALSGTSRRIGFSSAAARSGADRGPGLRPVDSHLGERAAPRRRRPARVRAIGPRVPTERPGVPESMSQTKSVGRPDPC